jgi:hypothetical protein
MKRLTQSLILLSLALPAPAAAAEASIVGTWRLQSVVRETILTGARAKEFGEKPDGYATYLPDGRMHAIIVIDDRMRPGPPPSPDATAGKKEDTTKIGTTIGYAGTYSVEGDRIFTRIDFSSNQKLTGTEQERFYKLDGDTMTLTTGTTRSPKDGQEGRTIAVWTRLPPDQVGGTAGKPVR